MRRTAHFALFILLLVLSFSPAFADDGDGSTDRGDTRIAKPARSLEPSYKIGAGIDGEIYPVFANYASLQKQSARSFGVVSVTVSNPTDSSLRQRIAVKIAGWSDQEIQIAEVAPGSAKTFVFAPSFFPRFYKNREIIAATAQISVSDMAGHVFYETTTPVRLRSAEDIYWGSNFQYAKFIASWVTPHDVRVESVLGQAKNFMADHRLPGYETWKSASQQEQETYREARAIFLALKRSGFSYVKSSATLGDHQDLSERVRMPRTSLAQSSANCIDAAVAYASLFENLGMDSMVVIVPGHAYAGLRVARGSDRFLFIDVALTGRAGFDAAVASAEKGMARYSPAGATRVLIQQARNAGVYPMP